MVTDQHVMPSDPDHLVAEHLAWNCGFPTFRFSPYFQRDWKRQVRAGKAESPRHFYTVDADSMHPNPRAARIAAEALYSVLTGRQPTERQSASFDAAEIASALGKPREPPDPLLERRPAYAVLLKQNRPQDAVAYLEQLLKDDPSDADAWCLRAGSYGADGDLLQALRCYDRALEIDPKHVEALVWRGVIDYTSGQTDTAIEFLQRALEHAPNHARACFHLGLAYARRSPDRAAIYFQRATELFPTYVEAHHYLGRIYLILNEPEQAEDACLRAIDIEYDNADAHYDLGRSYAMRGLSEQAVQSFTVAIQLSPQFAVAHLALGDAFQRTGDLSSAILHLKQASQLQPTETEAAGRLAWILATAHEDVLRDGPKAVELARHCVARDRNYHTLEILAAALAETGDFESALKYQQQAIEQAPENASNILRSRLEQYRKNRPLRD
ncbi:MAG: tetratricopeptide repeat protein [Fuerstiella sp.]